VRSVFVPWEQGSSVIVMTDYELDDRGSHCETGASDCCLVQIGSPCHLVSCSGCTGCSVHLV
jgi:flavoprotein